MQVPLHGSTKKPHPYVFVWDHQEAAQPLCLPRLWALCLPVPVTTSSCNRAACPWELNCPWERNHLMVPVSYGPVSNSPKIADTVSLLVPWWVSEIVVWGGERAAVVHLSPLVQNVQSISLAIPYLFSPMKPSRLSFWLYLLLQHGQAGEERQLQVKGLGGLLAGVLLRGTEPAVPARDWEGQIPGRCFRSFTGSSVTTTNSKNCHFQFFAS